MARKSKTEAPPELSVASAEFVKVLGLDFARTGNPIFVWRAISILLEPQGADGRFVRKEPAQMGEALSRLPPEMCVYLAEAAIRMDKLAVGLDWREPQPVSPDGRKINALTYALGMTKAPPPLGPTQAASLVGRALGLVREGDNSFAEYLRDFREHFVALISDLQPYPPEKFNSSARAAAKRKNLNWLMDKLGLADGAYAGAGGE